MYSIVFTAAIFIAIVFNDIIQQNTSRIALHGSFGFIAVGLVTILWYLNYEIVGWVLIALPILALTFSYIAVANKSKLTVMSSTASSTSTPSGTVAPGVASTSAPVQTTQLGCNLPGPYTAVAPPATSTVSLPASSSVTLPQPTPVTTAKPVPSFSITPITKSC
jgi:hypothetical protein